MIFKTSAEAFGYIESFTNLEKAPNLTAREYRLDRMFALLPLFGDPQKAFKSIHVAGSKGKGSTAAFIAGILTAGGRKTGLYSSPHVETYKERISASGKFFDERLYIDCASEMITTLEKEDGGARLPGGLPTTFELLTLLSFLIFRESGCEWAVFETGLGGRLDATNVIRPEISVLTLIELEHTEYLGDTIEKIAGEKAGIIKPGIPVISAPQPGAAETVFRKRAAELGCEISFLSELVPSIKTERVSDRNFAQKAVLLLKSGGSLSFNLLQAGNFQAQNAALAIAVLQNLMLKKENGLAGIDLTAGIAETALPGRMEQIRPGGNNIPVVLDGAHTRTSVKLSAEAFFETVDGNEGTLIFGAVDGKDVQAMAESLSGLFRRVIISTPGSFKKSSPDDVFKVFEEEGFDAVLEKDPAAALRKALSFGKPVFVTGSFYMVAEVRKLF